MSVDIFVQRGSGLKRGSNIDSPLICETPVALELGVNLLDKNSYQTTDTIQALYRPGVMPGQLAEVHDALQGKSWRGKITSMTITKSAPGEGLVLSMQIQRPA
jgi:hypothetical protein